MSAYISVSKPIEILIPLVREYLQPAGPLIGTGRGTATHQARHDGKREGIASAIAYILTERRADGYGYLTTVKQVSDFDVSKRLNEFLLEWTGADKVKTKSLLDEALNKLFELAYDDEHMQENAKIRREKILSGEIPAESATPEDLEFFRAEHEKQLAQVSRLGDIVGKDKVNR